MAAEPTGDAWLDRLFATHGHIGAELVWQIFMIGQIGAAIALSEDDDQTMEMIDGLEGTLADLQSAYNDVIDTMRSMIENARATIRERNKE